MPNEKNIVQKNRKPTRLPCYNYSLPGAYFITICTNNKKYLFGKIVNNEMKLSKIGFIIEKYWQEIPKHYEEVFLDTYQIMPNHIHGIISIEDVLKDNLDRARQRLFSIIGSFKSICTKDVNKLRNKSIFSKHVYVFPTIWQRSFYDRVIRNDKDLYHAQEYILNNPLKWKLDQLNRNKK